MNESQLTVECSSCGKGVERAGTRLDASYLADMLEGHGPIHKAVLCGTCRRRQRLYGLIALGLFVGAIVAVVAVLVL